MGSSGVADAEEPKERTRRRSKDHERDILRAAHWDAVARSAGTLRALHNGLQSLQPLVSTLHLETDFRRGKLEMSLLASTTNPSGLTIGGAMRENSVPERDQTIAKCCEAS